MAITTLDGLLAGMQPASAFHRLSATTEGAGTWHSLWLATGFPGAGATPPAFNAGSGYACTAATPGALYFANPSSGNSYLARLALHANAPGVFVLYDRLWTCSGFDTTTSPGAQTITTPGALPPRDIFGGTDGDGVELWGEVYAAPGTTGATWTVAYKDQDDNSASATYTHPANAESVGQMFPFVMAAGDTGVRSVVSLTCSASSTSAGDIGLTLLRRIAEIPSMSNNFPTTLDAIALNLPRLYDDSCLAIMLFCNTTSTGQVSGVFSVAQG